MKQYFVIIAVLITTIAGVENPAPQPGGIRGVVIDSHTEQALPGVNVYILDSGIGTATDAEGRFILDRLTPGSYHVRFEMMGYEPQTKLNLPVSPDRYLELTIRLQQTVLELQDIVVTPDFFKKAKDAVISDRSVDFTEIISDPGSSMDVQRMMQTLPSVVSGTDQYNEVIVRGGAPGENLFVMDNIEIPNPNHFGDQGSGGGPISMINPLFISEVDFYAGSFPARYGDKASSAMDIQLREGNREKRELEIDMAMHGIGAMVEGPIQNGQGSYLFSYHKSYLDLIIASTGMTAVPKYYSLQGKVVYDLNQKHRLIWNGVYGNDKIYIEEDAYTDISNIYLVDIKGYEYASGISWKGLWSQNLYSLLTLYKVENFWWNKVSTGEKGLLALKDDTESNLALKGDLVYRISPRSEITTGFSIKNLDYSYHNWSDADTLFGYHYFLDGSPVPQELTVWPYSGRVDSSIAVAELEYYDVWEIDHRIESRKLAAHFQYKWNPFARITLIGGLRYDYFDYTGFASLAPRLGLSYHFTPVTRLNFGVGRHYQSPVNYYLALNPLNSNLKNKYTDQVVLGFEHLFARDIRATIEFYSRQYNDIPIPVSMTTADSLDRSDNEYINAGKGHVEGIELFFQKKLYDRFHWILSYSYYVSKREDPRYPGKEYVSSFDFRNVFTFVLGYKEDLRDRSWYRQIKEQSWYKWTAWLLPLADEIEISLRWRYLGGKPYTLQKYDPYTQRWYISAGQPYNTERFPNYHRLDLMLARRFIFNKVNLVVFLDVQNVYNRDNIWDYSYTKDGIKEVIYQYKLMPVGGFTLEL